MTRKGDLEMKFWPFGIVWAREYGWLEVQDPWDGTWFKIPAGEAPTGWGRIASEARRPKNSQHYKTPRIGELEEQTSSKRAPGTTKKSEIEDLYARRLPGYGD